MQINSHLFQAAATIYSGLLRAPTNQLPQDPQHAVQAKELASAIFESSNHDGTMTKAAAEILVGFLGNPRSAHCTSTELVGWSVYAARSLIAAFATPAPILQSAPAVQQTQPPWAAPAPLTTHQSPQMPQANASPIPPPVPMPQPVFQAPVLSGQVPDFTDGKVS